MRATKVQREAAIGTSSPSHTPIFVCSGAEAVTDIFARTAPHRRADLVFMQNGIVRTLLPPDAPSPTVAVLYFSVLERGASATGGGCTFVHGRFAAVFSGVLRAGGLDCVEVATQQTIDSLAAEKLLWATCMWMVCHANGRLPVGQVHDSPACQAQLREVVNELLPVACQSVRPVHNRTGPDQQQPEVGCVGELPAALDSLSSVLARMEAYSRRIPEALPSKKLALEEIAHRSGWFLLHGDASRQPRHLALLEKNGVDVSALLSKVKPPQAA